MENKTFAIPQTRNLFRPLIEILDFIPPFSNLRPQTKDVLAELYYYYHIVYGEYPIEERNTLLFHHDNLQRMSDNLGIKLTIFQNNIGFLRNFGIIINSGYNKNRLEILVPPMESITFKLTPNGTPTK